MRTKNALAFGLFFFLAPVGPAFAGPFLDSGIAADAPLEWANAFAALVRGPQDVASPGGALASFGVGASALGPRDSNVVSLGDGGSIVLGFEHALTDGTGADFAVFENGFASAGGVFAELAFVEVSSNGADWARFASESLTPAPIGGFGTIDPTNVLGLAGKHAAPLGGGFDLALLGSSPLVIAGALDLAAVRFVRIVDAIGDGSTHDSSGRPIFDAYPTAFASGGFDLDAVGALHVVPEPGAALLATLGIAGLAVATGRRSEGLCRWCPRRS